MANSVGAGGAEPRCFRPRNKCSCRAVDIGSRDHGRRHRPQRRRRLAAFGIEPIAQFDKLGLKFLDPSFRGDHVLIELAMPTASALIKDRCTAPIRPSI